MFIRLEVYFVLIVFCTSCKIGIRSATPEVRYATPCGVATPSLGSPVLNTCLQIVRQQKTQLSCLINLGLFAEGCYDRGNRD